MKFLTISLLVILCSISFVQAQNDSYFEFADHQWISSSYIDMIPRGAESAYLIQNASVAKQKGKTLDRFYTPNWSKSDFNIFTTGEDTIIYMYNYSDYDIGTSVVTRIKIGKDSTQILNQVDDYFTMIELRVIDIIMTSHIP